jgi:hypothetical protein
VDKPREGLCASATDAIEKHSRYTESGHATAAARNKDFVNKLPRVWLAPVPTMSAISLRVHRSLSGRARERLFRRRLETAGGRRDAVRSVAVKDLYLSVSRRHSG